VTVYQLAGLLITLTALFSYLNHRYIRLPTTIGVMLIALLFSLGVIAVGHFEPGIAEMAADLLRKVEFDDALLQGMLSFLLFAGALHINLNDLAEKKLVIGVLSVVGVLLSTALFGGAIYVVLGWLGLDLDLIWCLLFGALISPTDPVAVLGILKSARVPKSLEIKIAGESLFNDGIGVVVFTVLREIAEGGKDPLAAPISVSFIAKLFLEEAVGGAVLGLFLGWLTYRMLRSVDNYQVELLLTLALVMGGYALASALHTSGPIAIVVAGLFVGNHGRRFGMSDSTREHLDTFWELVDEGLNALLFVLIGLEVLVLAFSRPLLLAGLLAIPAILAARWISVGIPMAVLRPFQRFTPGALTILTWGGLRGGISVALALSLPAGPERSVIVAMTYVVVVFSILVQGLTVRTVVNRVMSRVSPRGS
jgi:Na+:H+ antiporter